MASDLISAVALISLLGLPAAFAADRTDSRATRTDIDGSSIAESGLSETEQVRADLWTLTPIEWQRYQILMQGIRGSISPATISPIEVLGIHARDEAERRRYAERWAQAMREDVDRILAFQQAYDAAAKRLYSDEPLIDVNRLPRKVDVAAQYLGTDRFLLFAAPVCPPCDTLIQKLLERIDVVNGIDIYLTGLESTDDATVRAWAATQKIHPEWVRTRRVTLNHDGGALAKLTDGKVDLPMLFRRHGDSILPIEVSAL